MTDYIRIHGVKINKKSVVFKIINLINKIGPLLAPALEPKKIDINNVEVFVKNLPAGFNKFKILHISDIHPGKFIRYKYIKKVVDLSNTLDANLVVITGDFTDIDYNEFLWSVELLASLKNTHGIYGVLGNHDMWNYPEKICDSLQSVGIKILRNTFTTIQNNNDEIFLSGIDDIKHGIYDLKMALGGLDKDKPIILLSHNPDIVEELDGYNVDIVLSGHMHGGQWKLPFIGPPRIPSAFGLKYFEGLSRCGDTQVYTNRGIGSTFIPFRINCPPEISLIHLREHL